MAKQFEDLFTDIQADMISCCMEYCNSKAERIFVHCLNEANVITCNAFFLVDGKITKRSQIKGVNDEKQKSLVHSINEDIKKLESVCVKNKQPVPTEMKLVYDVVSGKFTADYSYELKYSNSDKLATEVFEEWFLEKNANK